MIVIHIFCGVSALIVGLISMSIRKFGGKHAKFGEIYHWLYFVLFLSAAILAIDNWSQSWWFLPIGMFSYAFALFGYLAAKCRKTNWLIHHVIGQSGSYIAMTTAVLVVNFGKYSWWVWLLPTIVGTVLIIWLTREIGAKRRPKYS